MKTISDYIKSVLFSISYSFRFAPGVTLILVFLFMLYGVLPYASSYFLGQLVNGIVYGIKSGNNSIWLLIILYSLSNAAPAILSNIELYLTRLRILKLQLEIETEF